jgi:hypothetical protein
MSFQDDLMRAEAIREIRASGCTTEGVAELIVDFHGAVHILTHVSEIQKLGQQVAASDTEQGAKMRQLLLEDAQKAEAIAQQKMAATKTSSAAAPAQLAGVDEKTKEAVDWLMTEHGYSESTAKEIAEKEGADAILGEKKWKQRENEKETSKSSASPSVPTGGSASETGSVSNAAADSSAPTAAAGTSAAPSTVAAQEGSDSPQTAQG